jgi:hypothetical protein
MGQYTRALPLFEQALKICETAFGPRHMDVASTYCVCRVPYCVCWGVLCAVSCVVRGVAHFGSLRQAR